MTIDLMQSGAMFAKVADDSPRIAVVGQNNLLSKPVSNVQEACSLHVERFVWHGIAIWLELELLLPLQASKRALFSTSARLVATATKQAGTIQLSRIITHSPERTQDHHSIRNQEPTFSNKPEP